MKDFVKKFLLISMIIILFPVFCTFLINQKESRGIYKKVDIEEYVPMVLYMTVDSEYMDETIKALSVLVRTNCNIYQNDTEFQKEILNLLKQKRNDMKFQKEIENLKMISDETFPVVLRFQGKFCEVPYHKISAGKTRFGEEVYRNHEYQYLTGVESATDIAANGYLTEHIFTLDVFYAKIVEHFPQIKDNRQELFSQIKVTEYDSVGYVLSIQIQDERVTGEEFRKCLDLESSNFVIEETEDGKIKISCKGVGHGLGMSLYGANQLAIQGYSYEQILKYYFPSLVIE